MAQVPEPATYQVFINYMAVDTRDTLARPIYDSLTIRELSVFMDHNEICTEDTLPSSIRGAISSASVYVIIFSDHYAESRCCLDELCCILKSSQQRTILPVFSDIEPAELRQIEKGRYAEAFRNHQGKVAVEKVETWKKVLREAADISGFVLKTNESDHGRFLEKIVNTVWKKVNGEPLLPEIYQVFINHRGPDSKLTHASLIYYRLRHCGLRVFLDAKELQGGSTLNDAIRGAISSSSVHIVIFSQRYAESRWCLDELRWILRSSQERTTTIIPIFFEVEPKDLRHNEGDGLYAKAFEYHQQNGGAVAEWKEALEKASEISGYIVKNKGSDYGMYLEEILSIALAKVTQGEPLEVATHPVGLDEVAKDFQNHIGILSDEDFQSNIGLLRDTKIVGITGMGGLGKSTLAKHLYNVRRSVFQRSCFLFNVKGRDVPSLQKQLIRDLLGHDLNIGNTIQEKSILKHALQEVRALIVLDDVDDVEQIDSLLDMDAVGSGSLILLTSRDKDLLRRSSLTSRDKDLLRSSPKTVLYDVKPLNTPHAQELFCHHAFFSPKPVKGFEDLVGEFLKICGGLPSSLIVLGRHLAGNDDKTFWKMQLEKFSIRLPDDIISTLKVSYEALSEEKKEMFLDIGYFLVGENRELAVRVLEGLGYSDVRDSLESLRHKCLLYMESNNDINYKYEPSRVMMHNQLKGLARHLVREELFKFAKHKPLRLSSSSDIEEMFQLQDDSEEACLTRGILVPKGENPPQPTNDVNIKGVRLLVVEHPMGLPSFAMSGNLVWLRLNSFPSISIPSKLSLARLRVLELHPPGDHLQQLFTGFNKLASELRNLKSGAIGAASESASSNRKQLDVEHYINVCRNIFSDQQGEMTSISGKLKTIPQQFPIDFGKLKNLRCLDLSSCTNLTELPDSFPELLHLQYLSLQYCINMSFRSNILGKISTLEYVHFKGCAKLVHLPEGMTNQRSLVDLNLEFCFELKTLTDLSNLERLKFLNINGCVKLETLNLKGLRSLENLNLEFCFELKTLTGLSNIERLKFLNINGCVKLETLNLKGLRSLEHLNLEFCSELKTLTDLSNLECLKFLIINGCVKLETLNLEGLRSLEDLNLEFCSELNTLTNLSNLERLKFLNINGCVKLETLNLEGLRSLEQIKADACWKLKNIEASGQQERLNCLKISTHTGVIWCVKLETLNLEVLRSVEQIKEETCWKLKSIEELGQREKLKCLQISTHSGGIWNDAFQFFTSPPYMSTAIFKGKANDDMEKEMGCILNNLDHITVTVLAVPATTKVTYYLDNDKSHNAIFMCSITNNVNGGFRVGFEVSKSPRPYQVYETLRAGGSGGRMFHIFMWTRDPKLPEDVSYKVVVYHYGKGNELDAEEVDKGWIVTGTDSQVLQVCKRVVSAFAV